MRVQFVHDLFIEWINVGIVLHEYISNDFLNILQIELHVELPAEVSHLEDTLSLELGCEVAMIHKNRDERDDSRAHFP